MIHCKIYFELYFFRILKSACELFVKKCTNYDGRKLRIKARKTITEMCKFLFL